MMLFLFFFFRWICYVCRDNYALMNGFINELKLTLFISLNKIVKHTTKADDEQE